MANSPPVLEAKLMAYAYGEPAKPDTQKHGISVHRGFLGFLQPDSAMPPVIDVVPTAPVGQLPTPASSVACLPTPLDETPDPDMSRSPCVSAAARSS